MELGVLEQPGHLRNGALGLHDHAEVDQERIAGILVGLMVPHVDFGLHVLSFLQYSETRLPKLLPPLHLQHPSTPDQVVQHLLNYQLKLLHYIFDRHIDLHPLEQLGFGFYSLHH